MVGMDPQFMKPLDEQDLYRKDMLSYNVSQISFVCKNLFPFLFDTNLEITGCRFLFFPFCSIWCTPCMIFGC